MRSRHVRPIALLLVGVCALSSCAGDDGINTSRESVAYYVAPNGDDTATGLDAPNAFRTLGHAARALAPGDSLFILPGTYTEQLVLEGLGDAAVVTTIMGINGLPVLTGSGGVAPGIACWGCHNVAISCLDLRDFDGAGVSLSGSQGVTVRDIVVSDVSGSGVEVRSSRDVVIEWLEITRVGASAVSFADVTGARVANNRASGVSGVPYDLDGTDIEAERNDIVG